MLSLSNLGGLGLNASLNASTALTGAANRAVDVLGAVFTNLPGSLGNFVRGAAPADIVALGGTVIPELGMRAGQSVTQLVAVGDRGLPLVNGATWSIVGGKDAAAFGVDRNGTLVLRDPSRLDFETSPLAQVQVRVTDSQGRSHTETLSFRVSDVNERPTDILVTPTGVGSSFAKGAELARLAASDPDGGDRHSFKVVGRGSDMFDVQGDRLVAKKAMDAGEYTLTLRATDRGGLSFEERVTVKVGAQNAAPTDVLLSSAAVAENAGPMKVVGTLSAVDADRADAHSFAISGGRDAGKFVLDGNALVLREGQDFEALQAPLEVQVRATDRAGASVVKTLSVSVTDVNEAPVSLEFRPDGTLFSNEGRGAEVGLAVAADADRGDALAFSLSGRDAALFAVDSRGVVTLTEAAGWNGGVAREFTLTATDRGGLSVSQSFSVRTQGVAPADIDVSAQSIQDGTKAGAKVADLLVSGLDPTNGVTWSIQGGPDASRFQLVGGELRTLEDVSAAAAGETRTVVLRATERDGAFREESFTFDVTPAPSTGGLTGLRLSDYAVSEGMPTNHTVARLLADGGATGVTFSVVGGPDAGKFAVQGDRLVLLTQEFSFSQPQLNVQVQATAPDGKAVVQDFSINVLAANYVAGSGMVTGAQGAPDVFMPDGSTGIMEVRGFDEADHDQLGMFFLFTDDQLSTSNVRMVGQDDLNVMVQVDDGSGWRDFALLRDAKSENGTLDGDGVADPLTAAQLDALTRAWLDDNVIHS